MLYSSWHVIVKEKMKGTLICFPTSIVLLVYSTSSGAKSHPRTGDRLSLTENSDFYYTRNGIYCSGHQYLRYDVSPRLFISVPEKTKVGSLYEACVCSIAYRIMLYSTEPHVNGDLSIADNII